MFQNWFTHLHPLFCISVHLASFVPWLISPRKTWKDEEKYAESGADQDIFHNPVRYPAGGISHLRENLNIPDYICKLMHVTT